MSADHLTKKSFDKSLLRECTVDGVNSRTNDVRLPGVRSPVVMHNNRSQWTTASKSKG